MPDTSSTVEGDVFLLLGQRQGRRNHGGYGAIAPLKFLTRAVAPPKVSTTPACLELEASSRAASPYRHCTVASLVPRLAEMPGNEAVDLTLVIPL